MRKAIQQTYTPPSRFKEAVAFIEVILFALAFVAIFTLIVQAQSSGF